MSAEAYIILALVVLSLALLALWKYETGKRRERDKVIASLYARIDGAEGALKGEG